MSVDVNQYYNLSQWAADIQICPAGLAYLLTSATGEACPPP